MVRTIRLLLLLEAATFMLAAMVHFGLFVQGFEHRQARIAEGVISLMLQESTRAEHPGWEEGKEVMDYDVISVGGGLGGAALAKAMAEHGARTLVLERETTFRDRVRGEGMEPWGVAETRALGIN